MSPQDPDHCCPGCGKPQRIFARYPWYFCQKCLAQAEDGEGRRLVFSNAGPMGGFLWYHADAPGLADATASLVICLLQHRPIHVHEARFGGIVAEPASSISLPHGRATQCVDLTGNPVSAEAMNRLRPFV